MKVIGLYQHERVGGRCAGNLGAAREFFIEITAEGIGVDAEFLDRRAHV